MALKSNLPCFPCDPLASARVVAWSGWNSARHQNCVPSLERCFEDRRTIVTADLFLGDEHVLCVSCPSTEIRPIHVEGYNPFARNAALVHHTASWSVRDTGLARARKKSRKKALKAQAKADRSLAIYIAECLTVPMTKTKMGWCSFCLTESVQRRCQKNYLRRDVYICSTCGYPTAVCQAPGCSHFVRHGAAAVWTDSFCAEHAHAIPSFERSNDKLSCLMEYKEHYKFDKRNLKKASTVAACSVGAAVLAIPASIGAAPAVAARLGIMGVLGTASTGTAISTLSGAALESASLAAIGGGALTAGGAGMAGGVAAVTAVGGGLAAATGMSISSSYYHSMKEFKITEWKSGRGPGIVAANGFLTKGDTNQAAWTTVLRKTYPNNPWYVVEWDSRNLAELRDYLIDIKSKASAAKIATTLAKKGMSKALRKFGPVLTLMFLGDLLKNPWLLALTHCNQASVVLADLINRTNGSFILAGHSLGARLMYQTASIIATANPNKIKGVHLIGGAISASEPWKDFGDAQGSTIYNYHSEKDLVLHLLYLLGNFGKKAVGAIGIPGRHAQIKNVNVRSTVKDHFSYLENISLKK